MARRSDQPHHRAEHPEHRGRTTVAPDEVYVRPRSRAVVFTAWLLVAGLSLAVILPVLALLFG